MPEPPGSQDRPPAGDRLARPHDRYFRTELQARTEQVALVTALFPDLADRLDPASFSAIDGTFVDEELRERQSDLVLQTTINGHETLLYFLLEHQRSVDPLMAVRLHRYSARIWDRYLAEHPKATRVPPIIPTVVYSGARPWTAPQDIRDALTIDDATAGNVEDYLPKQRYRLSDSTDLDPALLTRPLRIMLHLLTRAPGATDVDLLLAPLRGDFMSLLISRRGRIHLVAAFTYIIEVSEISPPSLRPFATDLGHTAEEALMTTAEQLRAEGRAEREVDLLLLQLTFKFGPLPPAAETAVQNATPEEREVWFKRVLTAATLDEFLN